MPFGTSRAREKGLGGYERCSLASALLVRGRREVERGHIAAAREFFARASELVPERAEPLTALGELALHSGDPRDAEVHYREALAREPSAPSFSGLGLAMIARGLYGEALAPFESALDLDGRCEAALYGLVHAGLRSGELALLEARLSRCSKLQPQDEDLAATLAGIQRLLRDPGLSPASAA